MKELHDTQDDDNYDHATSVRDPIPSTSAAQKSDKFMLGVSEPAVHDQSRVSNVSNGRDNYESDIEFEDGSTFHSDSISDDGDFPVHNNAKSNSADSSDDVSILDNNTLAEEIRQWSTECNINNDALKRLLSILGKYHDNIPKDPRTLLRTVTNYQICNVSGGRYHHFGMKKYLDALFRGIPVSLCLLRSHETIGYGVHE
jgi:hypothetical protein